MQARAAALSEAAGKAGQAEDRRGADIAAGDRVPAIERQQHEAKVHLLPPQLIVLTAWKGRPHPGGLCSLDQGDLVGLPRPAGQVEPSTDA